MNDKTRQSEKGLSAGVLAVVFLVCVGVCAVFFSLGFLVGYNEQASSAEPAAERVTSPSVVPPVVRPAPDSRARTDTPEAKTPGPSASSTAQVPAVPEPTASGAGSKDAERVSPPSARRAELGGTSGTREVRMGYAVQVDAFRAKRDADAVVRILKARRYPVFLVTPQYANSKDNLIRVQVGPFGSREDAEKVRAKLEQEGFKPFIKH